MNDPSTGSQDKEFTSALIVDDHPLFCDALSMTLQAVADIREIQTAASLEQALNHVAEHGSPDMVVLDLNLPDVDGLDGLVRLKTAAQVPVIVVSSMADDRVISSTIRAGAAGFIPKHSQREVFRAAFEALRAGDVFTPNGFVALDESSDKAMNHDVALTRLATLTRQQARILQLICEGKLNKQIAYDLTIAETTVKAHVTAIMRKLGVQSRTQAVLIAKEASFSSVLQDTQ
ncbi:response regulator [Actibacterium lipolyticum]|uniref:Transcriptional regulatory protein DegU n=1 Tax=Actibacterium lipolyticum TaxID=1524263 RepID=A0A238JV77_9RHOB|nr:response regulator transcription factor [Actibacterium lipolyticum]SMX34551.1 Transcriptional regulatory protein DegU [Actibacterium lipolyticum]